ncbi:hypothetical protein SAMN04488241_10426 [Sphingomonas rubra]|uniref:Uncharacterized protein n=1 Tax=Sphingomonas rubra TaxID=634430 RepID=A0A1I5RPG0_9SPHN|nr:hypothetical protein SAMN04488241_10426 [Sphingomonas rubra]
MAGVTFGMDALADLARGDGAALQGALAPLVVAYGDWSAGQRTAAAAPDIAGAAQRGRTAATLIAAQDDARARIAAGIALLADARVQMAFDIANRAVADAIRARRPGAAAPSWRPFQLAFILLNLSGMADRQHPDREVADLLFFPTGGGKTEAYLGLAAFTIALRRLGADGLLGAGVAVVMRYTLRLLTLDQLGRAAGLVCALELLRTGDAYRGDTGRPLLGDWPIEIGLWVGSDASPNRLGRKGDKTEGTAVKRVRAYTNGRDARATPHERGRARPDLDGGGGMARPITPGQHRDVLGRTRLRRGPRPVGAGRAAQGRDRARERPTRPPGPARPAFAGAARLTSGLHDVL